MKSWWQFEDTVVTVVVNIVVDGLEALAVLIDVSLVVQSSQINSLGSHWSRLGRVVGGRGGTIVVIWEYNWLDND